MSDYFLIAEVKSAFGVDGFIVIDSFSDFKDRFFDLKKVYIEIFGNKKQFVIEQVKQIDSKTVIKFAGFNSEADIIVLLGKNMFVDEDNLVRPDSDTHFIHDMLRSNVFRNDVNIGIVEDVLVLPANDVIVIASNNSRKILIPAIKDFVKSFDAKEKRLDLVNDCDLLYDDED